MNISDAAKVGDLETLKSAFARGVSVDQRDKYYKTPLMVACAHGNIEVAAYLLQIGWVNWSGVHCNLVVKCVSICVDLTDWTSLVLEKTRY